MSAPMNWRARAWPRSRPEPPNRAAMTPFILLDHAAVLVFALTGALVASRAQLDIVGFAFLAGLTGLGGGTLRDLLLDRTPVWIADPTYLAVVSGAAII